MPKPADSLPTHVEMIDPILCVRDLDRALRYYTEVLGFDAADWNTGEFTAVALGGCGIYLAQGAQGHPGAWVWVGVGDARALYRLTRGMRKIRTNVLRKTVRNSRRRSPAMPRESGYSDLCRNRAE